MMIKNKWSYNSKLAKLRMSGAAHTFAASKTILPLPFTATTARIHGANQRDGSL